MTFEQLLFAAVAGTLAAIATTVVGVYASRRFGLPGLARQVSGEQAALIDTLESSINDLRTRLAEQERLRLACETEIGAVRRDLRDTRIDLRDTEDELLALYRSTGKRPPRRLTDHERERS